MLVYHLPEATGVRIGGHTLEHDGGRAIGQRSVDDVGVPGYPADIGGAPVDITVVVIEDVLVGHGRVKLVAAAGVQYTLGLARGSRGIQDEQRVFGIHVFRRAVGGSFGHGLVVPHVTFCISRHVIAGALHHHGGMDIGAACQGLCDVGLEGYVFTAPRAFVSGNYDLAVGIQDPVTQGLR